MGGPAVWRGGREREEDASRARSRRPEEWAEGGVVRGLCTTTVNAFATSLLLEKVIQCVDQSVETSRGGVVQKDAAF